MENEITISHISNNNIMIAWSLAPSIPEFVGLYFGASYSNFRKAIRLYDITDCLFNGNNALSEYEVMIPDSEQAWKLKGLKLNREYVVEFGVKLSEYEFFPLIRSSSFKLHNSKNRKEHLSQSFTKKCSSKEKTKLPDWTNSVSTYTYYEGKGNWRKTYE